MSIISDLLEKTKIALEGYDDQLQLSPLEVKPEKSKQKSCLHSNYSSLTGPHDTVITQDVSGSMGTADYPPTRLAGGITAIIEYINARAKESPKDRMAVVTFTDRAKILLPLTAITDKKDIIEVVSQLTSGGGTDIAEGLQAAMQIFDQEPAVDRQRRLVLLTDGHGGRPVKIATELKQRYRAVIDVVGIGGTPKAVNESLLRKVATTDPDGFNHYRFVRDPETLREHYRQLATGLIWRGGKNDKS